MRYAKRGSYKEAKAIQIKKKFNEAKRLAEEQIKGGEKHANK